MVKNGRIWADEEPFQRLLAILGHFMPTSTWIFENGIAWSRCLSRCVASNFFVVFCRSHLFKNPGIDIYIEIEFMPPQKPIRTSEL